MRRYPHLFGFLGLFLLLVPPFVLTTLRPSLEPYPSIQLPAGGQTVAVVDGEIPYRTRSLLCFDAHADTLRSVDEKALFHPIPRQLQPYILNRKLGLELLGETTFRRKTGRPLSEVERQRRTEEVFDYFQTRLAAQGCREDRFVHRTQRLHLIPNTFGQPRKTILREDTIRLR